MAQLAARGSHNPKVASSILVGSRCLYSSVWQSMRLVSARSRVRSSLEAVIRVGVVGNISACHADARGSIPRHGGFNIFAAFWAQNGANTVPRPRGFPEYASIAQLAEHLLRKEKVTSSILVGGWVTGSHGLVGYDARLTRERSRVRASVRILCPFFFLTALHCGCDFVVFSRKNGQKRSKSALNLASPTTHTQKLARLYFVLGGQVPWACHLGANFGQWHGEGVCVCGCDFFTQKRSKTGLLRL